MSSLINVTLFEFSTKLKNKSILISSISEKTLNKILYSIFGCNKFRTLRFLFR